MKWKTELDYLRLDRESFDSDQHNAPQVALRRSNSYTRWTILQYLTLFLFILSLLLFVSAYSIFQTATSPNEVLRHMNTYTPLLSNLTFSFQNLRLNGSLFNDPYSIYRADPSPAVDAAWSEISQTRVLALSATELKNIGKDPSLAVRVPEEWGYGKDKFFGIINGQHLLHCLDTLRKFSHYTHYHLATHGPESTLPPLQAAHRSHCIGALLDALTCRPSIEVFTYVWMDGQQNPYPDFGIERKCVDHGGILEWQGRVGIRRELTDGDVDVPVGARVVPSLRQFGMLEGWRDNGSFPL